MYTHTHSICIQISGLCVLKYIRGILLLAQINFQKRFESGQGGRTSDTSREFIPETSLLKKRTIFDCFVLNIGSQQSYQHWWSFLNTYYSSVFLATEDWPLAWNSANGVLSQPLLSKKKEEKKAQAGNDLSDLSPISSHMRKKDILKHTHAYHT